MISIAEAYTKWKKEEKDYYNSLRVHHSEKYIFLLFEGIYLSVKERT